MAAKSKRTAKYEGLGRTNSDGQLMIFNKALWDRFFKENPDRLIEFDVRAIGDKHSDPLRRYYFAEVVGKIQMGLRAIGHDMDRQEVHEFCKTLSGVTVSEVLFENPTNGEVEVKTKTISLSRLDNAEFLEYIEDLKRFAAEHLHLIINDPSE